MRVVELGKLEQGISRLRDKGGADPKALYDLLNGQVNEASGASSRHGTSAAATLPAGTKGLMPHDGAFLVFSHEVVGSMPSGYTCAVLAHPDDASLTIADIHYAAPFLGDPYVVAEFSNGDTYHYWLQSGEEWEAEAAYTEGDVVVPGNGLAYRARRLSAPYPPWAPDVERTVGDRVEPTVPNGFYYEVIESQDAGSGSGIGSGGSNRSFEDDLNYWTPDVATAAGWSAEADGDAASGAYVAQYDPVAGGANDSSITSDEHFTCNAGQVVSVSIKARVPSGCVATINLAFFNSSDTQISSGSEGSEFPTSGAWATLSGDAIAPSGSAYYVPTLGVATDGTGIISFDYLSTSAEDP